MIRLGWFLATAVVALVLAGCYDFNARKQERLDNKIQNYREAHEGKDPSPEDVKLMDAEASKEEAAARAADVDQAKKDVVNGGIHLATGDYVTGAILIGGAILTFFGLKRSPPVKEGGTA